MTFMDKSIGMVELSGMVVPDHGKKQMSAQEMS